MSKRPKGFTLVELIFVILLISLLTSFAIPKVTNVLGINLRAGGIHLSAYLRSAYEYSVMRHEQIRIRFDMAQGTYWVESFDDSLTIPLMDESTKIDDALERFRKREDEMNSTDSEEKKARQDQRYKIIESTSLKRNTLPQGIKFKGVYTSSEGKVVLSGTPWVEFSPGGFVPKTIIYVTNDADQVYSVILEAIGGRSRVERGEVRPDEA